MRCLNVQGLVLKRIPYQNEKFGLFSVFTREKGKITISSPRGTRLDSKIRLLSPLNICELTLYTSSQGHYKVSDIYLKNSFHPMSRYGLPTLQWCFMISELLYLILEEEQAEIEIYQMTCKSLSILNLFGKPLIYEAFRTKLLNHLGSKPTLTHCYTCGEKLGKEGKLLYS
mgnify:FL=1